MIPLRHEEHMLRDEDSMQKTWVPEGTLEYLIFKSLTGETLYLADLLKAKFPLKRDELVLDVGGREGDISYSVQQPDFVHIVDPDPRIAVPPALGHFWNRKIQQVELRPSTYNLIICSHVLGYLGRQNVQRDVIGRLLSALAPGGSLVLFYNRNTSLMGDLLQ